MQRDKQIGTMVVCYFGAFLKRYEGIVIAREYHFSPELLLKMPLKNTGESKDKQRPVERQTTGQYL